MEVKINNNGEMLDATIEMVDGVMVVSPKEVKLDITKFKDGDVLTGGNKDDGGLYWTFILKGEIEHFHGDYKFAEEYVSLDNNGCFEINNYSDAIKWFRYATEEEKKKLFDKLAEEGWEFDFEKKELIKLKWTPICGALYYRPAIRKAEIKVSSDSWADNDLDKSYYDKGWAFKTYEECDAFCDKLRQAIEGVKP